MKNEGVMSDINITPAPIQVPRIPSVQFSSVSSVVSDASSRAVSVTENVAQSITTEVNTLTHQQLSVDTVKAAIVTGNALLQNVNRNLQFQVDDATKLVVVKIVDSKTGELVRQIPTVEMLDFIRHMKEMEGKAGSIMQDKA
jgi:flagellar protein FlaG